MDIETKLDLIKQVGEEIEGSGPSTLHIITSLMVSILLLTVQRSKRFPIRPT